MIVLGLIAAVCILVAAVCVWRIVTARLGCAGYEPPGDGGPDPMDLPGDGLSPFDRYLSELVAATSAPGG